MKERSREGGKEKEGEKRDGRVFPFGGGDDGAYQTPHLTLPFPVAHDALLLVRMGCQRWSRFTGDLRPLTEHSVHNTHTHPHARS